jgi:hypothetical protein
MGKAAERSKSCRDQAAQAALATERAWLACSSGRLGFVRIVGQLLMRQSERAEKCVDAWVSPVLRLDACVSSTQRRDPAGGRPGRGKARACGIGCPSPSLTHGVGPTRQRPGRDRGALPRLGSWQLLPPSLQKNISNFKIFRTV